MENQKISEMLEEMADILDMIGVEWKPMALRKAARNIETLSEDIGVIYKKKGIEGLRSIPGVGEGISSKIAEYLETGVMKELDELKKKVPKGVEEMMHIQGLGPKKAWKLYKKLGIDSIEKLEQSAKKGKIRKLGGFGEKSEEDILMGLGLLKKRYERVSIAMALPIAQEIQNKLKRLKEVDKVDIAGSIRRRKETVKDIDILVISKHPKKVTDFFTGMENVDVVVSKGDTRSSVVLKEGLNCDIRIVESKSYGSALDYFTGSKEHNVKLRGIAIKKGLKLSEYGIFNAKTNRYVCGKTEDEVYKKLGLKYIEPEMREDTGEIELVQEGKKLPKLISYNGIKGDLHMHTVWSDGMHSSEDMIKAGIERGYEYLAITDHSKSTYVANGLDEKRLLEHINEIDKLDKKYKKIKVLKGAEVDILKDGSLDYNDSILKKLDVVIGSIHSGFKNTKEQITKRLLRAIENPRLNIIAHPTGRLINQRNPYDFDFDLILGKAKENNVALEINSFPSRLDLKDVHIKSAIERGVKLAINTDSHSTDHLKFMEFGIAQARRGWATEDDVINSWTFKKFEKFIRK